MIDFTPVILSFRLALLCTIILTVIGVPISYWLTSSQSLLKFFLRSAVLLPLILPPSVLGFYFLLLWSPMSPVGQMLEKVFHTRLVFSFEGLVIALVIAGLPFMINPLMAGFENLSPSLKEASNTLGKSNFETLVRVLLPSIRPSLFIGIIMTFVHTFGEFGLVLMLGGKIPGKTLTSSIALYDHVEALEFSQAHIYAALITLSAFLSLILLFIVNKKTRAGL